MATKRTKQPAAKKTEARPRHRRGHSKDKGGAFERKIAKLLSLWLTVGQDAHQLIRSVASGGWRPGQSSPLTKWRHIGDLAPNGAVGDAFRKRFAVECKHHKEIDFWSFWTCERHTKTLAAWWAKLQKEVEGTGCHPMLIFKANNSPVMVGVRASTIAVTWFSKVMIVEWLDLAIAPLDELLLHPPTAAIATDSPALRPLPDTE